MNNEQGNELSSPKDTSEDEDEEGIGGSSEQEPVDVKRCDLSFELHAVVKRSKSSFFDFLLVLSVSAVMTRNEHKHEGNQLEASKRD